MKNPVIRPNFAKAQKNHVVKPEEPTLYALERAEHIPASQQAVRIEPNGPARQMTTASGPVTFVPLTIRRRQTRKLLVPPAGSESESASSSFDLPLIRTLGKAYYWQQLLDSGEAKDIGDIAKRFKLEKGWVCEVMRMTRLAPDIVQAIVEGRQPRHLNLHAVRGRQVEVPVVWDEQRVLLGVIAI